MGAQAMPRCRPRFISRATSSFVLLYSSRDAQRAIIHVDGSTSTFSETPHVVETASRGAVARATAAFDDSVVDVGCFGAIRRRRPRASITWAGTLGVCSRTLRQRESVLANAGKRRGRRSTSVSPGLILDRSPQDPYKPSLSFGFVSARGIGECVTGRT